MKKFRKIMAILVAAVMIVAMAVPAWAAGPGAYTLTYDPNGGNTPNPANQTASSDPFTITIDTNATRDADEEGRAFVLLGWTEVKDSHIYSKGDTLNTDKVYVSSNTITLSADRVLYAVWGYDLDGDTTADVKENGTTHVVSYDGRGAELNSVPETVSVPNGDYVISKKVPVRTGYTFLGWTTAAKADVPVTESSPIDTTGSYKQNATGTVTYTLAETDGDVTLYAWWAADANGNDTPDCEETQYSLTYDLNAQASKDDIIRTIEKADSTAAVDNTYMGLTTPTVSNIISDYKIELAELKTEDVKGIKAHYEKTGEYVNVAFMGWTSNQDESWTIHETTATAPNMKISPYTVPSNGTTLYALWGYDRDKNGKADALEAVVPDQASTNTITITNAKNGETYGAYRMLILRANATGNATPTAYAYTVDPDWEEFFSDANASAWNQVLERYQDNPKYMRRKGESTSATTDDVADEDDSWAANAVVAEMAEAAAEYVKTHNIQPESADGQKTAPADGNIVLSVPTAGYYLVTSTLGTRAMIDTTPGNVTKVDKNVSNEVEKKVYENNSWAEENDAQIGDTVEFRIKATLVPRTRNVHIKDTLSAGLTLNTGSIMLYEDENKTILYKDYTLESSSATAFDISIPDSFTAETTENDYIYVFYTATLNSAAVDNTPAVVDHTNTAKVTFGDASEVTATTTTRTRKFEVKKFATGINNLEDAVFQLKRGEEIVNLVKINGTNYRVADSNDGTTFDSHMDGTGGLTARADGAKVSDFVTVDSGNITILGLDSDATYYLEELQAPNGYYKLADKVDVSDKVVDTNNGVASIENKTGAELPTTGGMGTTVLYIVGGMLVILAGAYLFFSRKRTA